MFSYLRSRSTWPTSQPFARTSLASQFLPCPAGLSSNGCVGVFVLTKTRMCFPGHVDNTVNTLPTITWFKILLHSGNTCNPWVSEISTSSVSTTSRIQWDPQGETVGATAATWPQVGLPISIVSDVVSIYMHLVSELATASLLVHGESLANTVASQWAVVHIVLAC